MRHRILQIFCVLFFLGLAIRAACPPVFSQDAPAVDEGAEGIGDFQRLRDDEAGFTIRLAGSPAWRHDDEIRSIHLLPDSHRVLTGARDGGIRLWNLETGDELACLGRTEGRLERLALSADGMLALSSSETGQVALWRIEDGDTAKAGFVRQFETVPGGAAAAIFSGDETQVIAGGRRGSIYCWNLSTAERLSVRTLPSDKARITDLAVGAESKLLASGSDGKIYVYEGDAVEASTSLVGHKKTIHRIVASPDGTTLLSCGADETVMLWDLARNRNVAVFEDIRGSQPTDAMFYPGGERAVVVAGAVLHRVEIKDRKLGRRFYYRAGTLESVAVSSDGERVLAGGPDHVLYEFDGDNVLPRRMPKAPARSFLAVAFSPDESMLAAGGWDRCVYLWDVGSGKQIAKLEGHEGAVRALRWLDDGRLLSGGADTYAIVWDVKEQGERRRISGFSAGIRALSSGGGMIYAAAGGNELYGLGVDAEKVAFTRTLATPAHAVAVSPDGRWAAVDGGQGRTVVVFHAADGGESHRLPVSSLCVTGLEFVGDGEQLLVALGPEEKVQRWQVEERKLLNEFSVGEGWLSGLALAETEGVCIVGSQQGSLQWRTSADGETVCDIENRMTSAPGTFASGVAALAAGRSGRTVATANRNGTVTLLQTKSK